MDKLFKTNIGHKLLNKSLNKIKDIGITNETVDIFIVKNYLKKDAYIKKENTNKYLDDINIIMNNIDVLKPQLLFGSNYFISIYDTDFSYTGQHINNNDLVHFYLSNENKLQIIIQKGKNGYLVDKYIFENGKQNPIFL